MTRLYSSGVLRYAENDSDMDFNLRTKVTSKGGSIFAGETNYILKKVWALPL